MDTVVFLLYSVFCRKIEALNISEMSEASTIKVCGVRIRAKLFFVLTASSSYNASETHSNEGIYLYI
jgi:hypothetical protein